MHFTDLDIRIFVSGVIMATPIMGSTSRENKGASNGIQIWIVTFVAKVVLAVAVNTIRLGILGWK